MSRSPRPARWDDPPARSRCSPRRGPWTTLSRFGRPGRWEEILLANRRASRGAASPGREPRRPRESCRGESRVRSSRPCLGPNARPTRAPPRACSRFRVAVLESARDRVPRVPLDAPFGFGWLREARADAAHRAERAEARCGDVEQALASAPALRRRLAPRRARVAFALEAVEHGVDRAECHGAARLRCEPLLYGHAVGLFPEARSGEEHQLFKSGQPFLHIK